MVQVVNYALRKTSEGKEFVALIQQRGLSLVQSKNTGNFYATVKQCSILSTFDENSAKSFVGERIPGSVVRKECETYQWTNKETGEVIELAHRWVYVPEGGSVEDAIIEGQPKMALVEQNPRAMVTASF